MDITKFKDKVSIINEIIYFDKDNYLRETTTESTLIIQIIHEAESLLKVNNDKDNQYFLHGIIGNLYRISEKPKKAIIYLTYCFNQAVDEENIIREIVSLIRLGEAFKYDNNHDKAMDCFNKAMKKCEMYNVDEYMDFVLQHKGKCLMELRRLDEADECFQIALTLRRSKGNETLIESTEQAIELLRKMKNE